jgi:hypothetical protein
LSKCLKDGSIKKHDSFLAKYYEGVRLVSKRKSCWDEVETLVDEVVSAHRAQDPERLELTGMDRRIYLVAGAALKPVGKPVDLAAIGFVAAAKLSSLSNSIYAKPRSWSPMRSRGKTPPFPPRWISFCNTVRP